MLIFLLDYFISFTCPYFIGFIIDVGARFVWENHPFVFELFYFFFFSFFFPFQKVYFIFILFQQTSNNTTSTLSLNLWEGSFINPSIHPCTRPFPPFFNTLPYHPLTKYNKLKIFKKKISLFSIILSFLLIQILLTVKNFIRKLKEFINFQIKKISFFANEISSTQRPSQLNIVFVFVL